MLSSFRYLLSVLLGFIAASAIFVFLIIPQVKDNWRAQGQNEAALRTNRDIYMKAEKYFSRSLTSCKYITTLAGAKPATIDIVDCGSYRTLEVVND